MLVDEIKVSKRYLKTVTTLLASTSLTWYFSFRSVNSKWSFVFVVFQKKIDWIFNIYSFVHINLFNETRGPKIVCIRPSVFVHLFWFLSIDIVCLVFLFLSVKLAVSCCIFIVLRQAAASIGISWPLSPCVIMFLYYYQFTIILVNCVWTEKDSWREWSENDAWSHK